MAMEEPNTRVVGLESDDKVGLRVSVKSVSDHWLISWSVRRRFVVVDRVRSGLVVWTTLDNLEDVTVQMERMLTSIVVVQDNLDNLVLLQDEGVCVGTIDGLLQGDGVVWCRKNGTKGWNFRSDVGDVVEEGVVDTVVQVVHDDVDGDLVIIVIVGFVVVDRGQPEIVEELLNVDLDFFRPPVRGVVLKIVGDVGGNDSWGVKHGHVGQLHHGIVLGRVLLGLKQDVVSLGDSNVDNLRLVRLYINTVDGDNREVVVFDREVLGDKTSDVDDSEEVGLVWLDVKRAVHVAVHQEGLWDWLCAGGVEHVEERLGQGGDVVVVPFGQLNNSFLVVLFCVGVLRVTDDERTPHTVHVLALTVRVVPEGADLVGHGEVVGERLAGRNFTLRQARHTVHLVVVVLEETVEVDRRVGHAQAVVQVDHHPVTLRDVDGWPRVCAVAPDNVAHLCEPVRVLRQVGSVPLEVVGLGQDQAGERGQRKQRAGKLHGGVDSGCTRRMENEESATVAVAVAVADPPTSPPAGNVSGIYISSLSLLCVSCC